MAAGISCPPNTIVVFSDIGCPWASLALHWLRRESASRELVIEHRAFPLELFNRRGTPKPILDAEIAVIASTEPELGWRPWQRAESEYPVTMLPALEAVRAARSPEVGGARAADQLDAALRKAFYVDSRTISLYSEIISVAEECSELDAARLAWELRRGHHREAVHEDFEISSSDLVQGSPHVFLPGGRSVHNPGVRFAWTAPYGQGFPVIREYDPGVWRALVHASISTSRQQKEENDVDRLG
ncbi:DsbA family oxidoreductase [Amycolatopsis echigonensis]|uniref:Dithiol-disulfide isomerase n=1 Tax=Amycolatopsis echigonensis TaxID=2576905 RepID=A0A8E1VYH3_9PSEU|nr:dithiol-disulfide isomerase [Amycolatopsis echigonensis]MBB2500555.1 dithiol-disulfide isomerase [Amycolatopsis echigonensis]